MLRREEKAGRRGADPCSWLLRHLLLIDLRVDLAVGKHPLGPELQRLHGDGDTLQLFADVDEIVDFIIGDMPISGNFDEAFLLLVHRIQHNGRKLPHGHLGHILLPDGALAGTIIVAQ